MPGVKSRFEESKMPKPSEIWSITRWPRNASKKLAPKLVAFVIWVRLRRPSELSEETMPFAIKRCLRATSIRKRGSVLMKDRFSMQLMQIHLPSAEIPRSMSLCSEVIAPPVEVPCQMQGMTLCSKVSQPSRTSAAGAVHQQIKLELHRRVRRRSQLNLLDPHCKLKT